MPTAASMHEVIPRDSRSAPAASIEPTSSSTPSFGSTSITRSRPVSARRPVSRPPSRSISPPGGEGVSSVMPARASAAEFATARWPSVRTM